MQKTLLALNGFSTLEMLCNDFRALRGCTNENANAADRDCPRSGGFDLRMPVEVLSPAVLLTGGGVQSGGSAMSGTVSGSMSRALRCRSASRRRRPSCGPAAPGGVRFARACFRPRFRSRFRSRGAVSQRQLWSLIGSMPARSSWNEKS